VPYEFLFDWLSGVPRGRRWATVEGTSPPFIGLGAEALANRYAVLALESAVVAFV